MLVSVTIISVMYWWRIEDVFDVKRGPSQNHAMQISSWSGSPGSG